MESDEERLLHEALVERAREALESASETVEQSEVLAHLSEALVDDELLRRCAWCGRYHIGERWLTVAGPASPLRWGRLTHGICPDCVDNLRRSGKSV